MRWQFTAEAQRRQRFRREKKRREREETSLPLSAKSLRRGERALVKEDF
jgi:hypothetical protein